MNNLTYRKIDFARKHAAAYARAYNFSGEQMYTPPAPTPATPMATTPQAPATPLPYAPAYPGTQPPNFVQRHLLGTSAAVVGAPLAAGLLATGGLWMSGLPRWAKIAGTVAMPFLSGYGFHKAARAWVPKALAGVNLTDPAARRQYTAYVDNQAGKPITGEDAFSEFTPEELSEIQRRHLSGEK